MKVDQTPLTHLGWDVDKSLIDKEPNILVEQICDVLQDLPVPALGSLLQQESPQTTDGIPVRGTDEKI